MLMIPECVGIHNPKLSTKSEINAFLGKVHVATDREKTMV